MTDAFEIRPADRATPAGVSPGVVIKLGRRRERFWARVEEVRSDALICTVD